MVRKPKLKEEYAVVLDYLPHGEPIKGISDPCVYALGTKYFTLLLLIPKRDAKIDPLEEVYIGEGERPKIRTVLKKIKYEDLSPLAKDNLPRAIEYLIKKNEKKFIDFFNNAGPINIKVHSLELLPGVGKVLLNRILEEREKEPFKSLEDVKKRVKGLGDPIELLKERILKEIKGEERYRLFVP